MAKRIKITGLSKRQETLVGAAFGSLRDNLDARNEAITAVRPEHEPITPEEVDTLLYQIAGAAKVTRVKKELLHLLGLIVTFIVVFAIVKYAQSLW